MCGRAANSPAGSTRSGARNKWSSSSATWTSPSTILVWLVVGYHSFVGSNCRMSRRCSNAAAVQLRQCRIGTSLLFVQRNSPFSQTGQVIPFQIERLNVGGDFNLASGIFTAPRPGTYFFSFSWTRGHSSKRASFVRLYLNGILIGTADGCNEYDYLTLTLRATVKLGKSDQIKLVLESG